jgi:NAD(P)-dependent dehydrogenase (short-subunit alcohol dehydrogenase family)
MDVQQELGDQSASELHESTGIPVQFYKVAVRDADAIQEVVANVVDTFGSVDVLINSAGIAEYVTIILLGRSKESKLTSIFSSTSKRKTTTPRCSAALSTSMSGSFLVAQACGRAMIAAGNGGSIIFIASMSGSIVNYPQEQSCYNASKAAVIQLGRSRALNGPSTSASLHLSGVHGRR